MGVGLVAPAFLAGLLVLAVPIIVHLRQRQQSTTVGYPSLMFLRRVSHQRVRRRQLRHRLLLLLRCSGLVLLALAFSRPFFGDPTANVFVEPGAVESVILLDQSASMAYGDRWPRAQRAVLDALDKMASGDHGSLVLFAAEAELVAQSDDSIRAAVQAASPGNAVTRFGPALRLGARLLDESARLHRQLLLISDFQRRGSEEAEVQLPEGALVTAVDVGQPEVSNLAVADVRLQRHYEPGSEDRVGLGVEMLRPTIRLTNQGAKLFQSVEVQLQLGESLIESRTVDVEPNSSVSVIFEPFALPGDVKGKVVAGHDALARDNVFYFALSPGQAVGVLLIEHPRASASDSFFLRQALQIGSRPPFRVDVRELSELTDAALEGQSLVILNDSGLPSGPGGEKLLDFVAEGGGVLMVLGELQHPGSVSTAAATLLPSGVGIPVDRSAELGGTLAYFDSTHPIFTLFRAQGSGDFASTRFYRYRALDPAPEQSILARFDDGRVALAESSLAKGKVLVWTSSLDTFWNDLALKPVFLPFLQQVARYTAGYTEEPPWQSIGSGVALRQPLISARLRSPSGRVWDLHRDAAAAWPLFDEPGFWDLAWGKDGEQGSGTVAVNLERAESDLARIDPEELVATLQWSSDSVGSVSPQPVQPGSEHPQNLWWIALVLVFAVLASETLLSNWLSSRTPAVGKPALVR